MKVIAKSLVALACIGTIVPLRVQASGVPVIDATAIAHAVTQIELLKNQIEQARQSFEAVTGSRGIGALLNSELDRIGRRYLPSSFYDLQRITAGTPAGAQLLNLVNYYKDQLSRSLPVRFPTGSPQATMYEQMIEQQAANKALLHAAYESVEARLQNIETLMSAIDSTSDMKGAEELNARITSESALVQNEVARLQALQMQLQMSDEEVRQRNDAALIQFWEGKAPPPATR